MTIEARLELYRRIEEKRKRPLVVYVTSNRPNATGQIASDSVAEILEQLQKLPSKTSELDFLIVSDGGDPTVAWRMVSLIRERVRRLSVLVPQAAYSAATLVALGADEIVMHPNGNLGPTDPQIRVPRRVGKDGTVEPVGFGSEDLMAFLRFSKEAVGLTDQERILSVYSRFCEEVGAVAIGVAARSALLTVTMGEKLLQLHMTTESDKQRARAISEKLTKDFFHHGYPVSRTEATEIGLKVADRDVELEELMWAVWSDLRQELQIREPHNPISCLMRDPNCAPLFAPLSQVVLPGNVPPAIAQQAFQQVLQQVTVSNVPPTRFTLIHAVMESTRISSRCVTEGLLFGARLPEQQVRVTAVNERQGWIDTPIPGPAEKPRAAQRRRVSEKR